MSDKAPTQRMRRRAVRLTPEAVAVLRTAIDQAWRDSGGKGRLTREAKAEMLGLSVSTAERVLARGGVDRSTVTLAFARLDLPWDERYLDSDVDSQPQTDKPTAGPIPPVAVTVSHPPRTATAPLMLAGALVTIAALGAPALMSRKAQASSADPISESTASLLSGSAAFHAGQYGVAQNKVTEAIKLASTYRDTGSMAAALRVEGDIAEAKGDYETALLRYGTALTLRQVAKNEVSYPALYEALGALRLRTGDLKQAEADLETSYRLYSRFRDRVGVAMAARDLGTLWYLRNDWVRAGEWFAKALENVAGQDKQELLTDINARQALVTAEIGDTAKARKVLEGALAFWMGKKHLRWQAETLQQLGALSVIEGDQPSARGFFKKSQELFQQAGDRAGSERSAKLAGPP